MAAHIEEGGAKGKRAQRRRAVARDPDWVGDRPAEPSKKSGIVTELAEGPADV
jgi:hypothetical protein